MAGFRTGVDVHSLPIFSFWQRLARVIWSISYFMFFRYTPTPCFRWRRILINLFGGHVESGAKVYPSVKIWAPWNLIMEKNSAIGPDVDVYSIEKILIQERATVSQRAVLCCGSHDINSPTFDLIAKPITVGRYAWVAAEAFVGPGVTIGDYAVLGARACAFKDIPPDSIAVGMPAKVIGIRKIRTERGDLA
jgi:putative colanic acid biosynthesis acetyltransferase WcaF